jgi:hypothetical protein
VEFGPPIPVGENDDYLAQTALLRGRVMEMWETLHRERAGMPAGR